MCVKVFNVSTFIRPLTSLEGISGLGFSTSLRQAQGRMLEMTTSLLVEGRGEVDARSPPPPPPPSPSPTDTVIPNEVRELIKPNENFISKFKFRGIRYMLVTTTHQIENHTIMDYIGIVTGESIIGANFVKDLFSSISDIVGGRANSYERVMKEAKFIALNEIQRQAHQWNSNAIVGVSVNNSNIGGMMMVEAPELP
jgi:uncharacterized protein YbjQ (UPF0145 family)